MADVSVPLRSSGSDTLIKPGFLIGCRHESSLSACRTQGSWRSVSEAYSKHPGPHYS
jgi:hypothetical protein